MMRPTYERQADREAEAAAVAKLARFGDLTPVKLPKFYKVDFALVGADGAIKRWIEVKCRTNEMWAYPTYMVSYHKYLDLLALQQASGIPACLVVQWQDALGVLRFPAPHKVGFGGRRDRGDNDDVEPVALINIAEFRRMAT
jgi:hypothetical protein